MQINGDGPGFGVDVTVLEDLGATRLIHARLGKQEIVMAQDADLPLPNGRINVVFRPDDVHLFDQDTGRRIEA